MSFSKNNIPRAFDEEPRSQSWKRMLAQIPAERQPAEELKNFFTAAQVQDFVFMSGVVLNDDNSIAYFPFSILATTPDDAQQRAKALLTILDQGYSRPSQIGLFKQRGELCQQLRESEMKLVAADKDYQAVAEDFKQYRDFPDETLTGLRVQLFQWEAELAGLRAKIEACDKLLKADGTAERRKQIEEARVAAEIELAGCEGRRAKSAEFVAKVKQRREVQHKRDLAQQQLNETRHLRDNLAAAVKRIDEEIDMFGPVRLLDDTVTIQPVEWTKKSDTGFRGSKSR